MSRNHRYGPRDDMFHGSDEMLYINGGAAVTKNQILRQAGTQGHWKVLIPSQASTMADVLAPLYLAMSASRVDAIKHLQNNGVATTKGTISGVDTSSATALDPVYLSATTSGGWTLTRPAFWVRKIGTVQKVHATDGVIEFDGTPPHCIGRTLTIPAASSSVGTSVGALYEGTAVIAVVRGTAADESVADATLTSINRIYWNGSGAITIEGNANATADTLVSVFFYPYG